jgi:hypothetical protein
MKRLIFCVLILSTIACHGCVAVPLDFRYSAVGRGYIDPSFITVGVTTKEDVVLRCGYPSATVSDDEKVFTYSWDTSIVQSYPFSDSPRSYTTYLNIHFDENDIVKSYTFE